MTEEDASSEDGESDGEQDGESVPLAGLRADLNGTAEGDANETSESESTDSSEPEGGRSPSEAERSERPDSIPLSGLRDSLEEPEETGEPVFHRETIEEVDADGVWADLLMDEEDPEGRFRATAVEEGPEGPTQVISKRICERCRYVEDPPLLHCTHEGTTIHELTDVEHVRVSNCPMVGDDGTTRSASAADQNEGAAAEAERSE
ncbi:MAG: hypothetical protein ACOCP3_01330 [Halodesulfurarchaeum sp.]